MAEVHVYIEIDDLERGIAFYVEGLGLSVARRLTARWVELAGAQMPIHLLARPEPRFESGEHVLIKDFGRHWTPIHLDFVVDDLDAAVERAVRAGATIERRVDHPGLWRLVALADPFGHGFDLIEDPEPGYARLTAGFGDAHVRPGDTCLARASTSSRESASVCAAATNARLTSREPPTASQPERGPFPREAGGAAPTTT
jgi:predicted enzyme related to lactoylglutathione lyase